MKADQRIELVVAGRRLADCLGHLGGVAGEVVFKTGIALCGGPERAGTDAGPGRTPANGPGEAIGAARIGIGFEPAISAPPAAALPFADQRLTCSAERAGSRRGEHPVERGIDSRDLVSGKPATEHRSDGIEHRLAVHESSPPALRRRN